MPRIIKPLEKNGFHFYDDFDASANATSFALSHLRQHGAPFILVIDREGRITGADRRPGWRDILETVPGPGGDRLPDWLARVVARHAASPPPDEAATVTIAEADVVVSIVALEGRHEHFACSIWRIDREQTLDSARRRFALTPRECELLDRILHGESSAEISRMLSISLATVEWHTKRLLLKTDSQNRTQMATRVLGWLPDA